MLTFATLNGEMLEWLKRHAWKVCIPVKGYLGFESLSLRLRPPKRAMADEVRNSAAKEGRFYPLKLQRKRASNLNVQQSLYFVGHFYFHVVLRLYPRTQQWQTLCRLYR